MMTTKQEKNVYQWVAIFSISMFLATGWKYVKLKEAYQQAEKDKVHYCKKYHELKCEAEHNNVVISELTEENQILSSMFATIEGEEGGSEILNKLWDEQR